MGDEMHANLASKYAALADTRGIMLEAADHVSELHDAAQHWGKALIAAGLPEFAWRSEKTYLRQLSDELPAVSIGAFINRLDNFAVHRGITWLHGDQYDLVAFRNEVTVLAGVVRPLCEAVRRLHKPTVGNSSEGRSFPRVLSHPRVLQPLEEMSELLDGLVALSSFLRPLTPEQWQAPTSSLLVTVESLPSQPPATGSWPRTAPLDGTSSWPAAESSTAARGLSRDIGTAQRLRRVTSAVSSRLRQPNTRRRLAVLAALVAVLLVTTLVLSHQLGGTTASRAITGKTSSNPSKGGTPREQVPTADATAIPSATAQSTAVPSPKLALTCAVQGATATLTIANAGTASVTWQAQPPPTLTVTPSQGTLDAGQTTPAQVTAPHKKSASGTITVVATQGGAAASFAVTCR